MGRTPATLFGEDFSNIGPRHRRKTSSYAIRYVTRPAGWATPYEALAIEPIPGAVQYAAEATWLVPSHEGSSFGNTPRLELAEDSILSICDLVAAFDKEADGGSTRFG